jgi:hypothetical protein
MLKSELPHEAPNPVSKKAPRVHHHARRRGGIMAARGARAAAGADAADRRYNQLMEKLVGRIA